MTSAHPEREDWGFCTSPGCGRYVAIRKYGVCNRHYRLLGRLRGRELSLDATEIAVQFWGKARKGSSGSCWEWTGSPHKHGHGTFWHRNVSYHAHIVSYQLAKGPIPEGLVIDHKCRKRLCVNPDHLHAVTRKQNAENIGLRVDNTSGYRGVTQRPDTGKWRARVGHLGSVIHIGDFDTPELANEAVISARLSLHTNNLEDRGETYG